MSLTAASASLNALADRLLTHTSILQPSPTSTSILGLRLSHTRSSLLTTGLTTIALLSSAYLLWDKHRWTAFGTGGTPPTWAGYIKANIKLRLLRFLTFDSLRDVSTYSSSGASYLSLPGGGNTLPQRPTPRPSINSWTLPQRQATYQGPESSNTALLERVHGMVAKYAKMHPTLLRADLSNTEGRSTDAVYAVHHAGNGGGNPEASDRVLAGEIAHAHPQEHSLHVWLSEADAREVVAKGWGERFPLGSLGWVHKGWTFVYAPVDEAELEVVEEIVRAGIRFVTGREDLVF